MEIYAFLRLFFLFSLKSLTKDPLKSQCGSFGMSELVRSLAKGQRNGDIGFVYGKSGPQGRDIHQPLLPLLLHLEISHSPRPGIFLFSH